MLCNGQYLIEMSSNQHTQIYFSVPRALSINSLKIKCLPHPCLRIMSNHKQGWLCFCFFMLALWIACKKTLSINNPCVFITLTKSQPQVEELSRSKELKVRLIALLTAISIVHRQFILGSQRPSRFGSGEPNMPIGMVRQPPHPCAGPEKSNDK